MPHTDFNNYDGFIVTNMDLVKTIILAIISVIAIYVAYDWSILLFMLILLPCMLLWFMLLREWLVIISIKTPTSWRRLVNVIGFLLIPFLATFLNGGPTLSLRWLKLNISHALNHPWDWGNGPLNNNGFVAGLFLTSFFIMFVTYLKRSRQFNQDEWTPSYPLHISLYLSLIALIFSFCSGSVYMNLTAAPAFLIYVVFFNLSFLISYYMSPYIFLKIDIK